MQSATILAGIALVHLLAVASPGPTFAVVMSYAVRGDRRAGFLLTGGVLLATLTWALATAAGLGTAMARFPLAYRALQIAGACYLVYLGVRLLASAWRSGASVAAASAAPSASGFEAVRAGFITNMSNPKVIAYYASLFGVLIPAAAPQWLFWASVAVVAAVSAAWWSAVTLFFSLPPVRYAYLKARLGMDIAMGAILIVLGARLALVG
jgi:threonine efflux protein